MVGTLRGDSSYPGAFEAEALVQNTGEFWDGEAASSFREHDADRTGEHVDHMKVEADHPKQKVRPQVGSQSSQADREEISQTWPPIDSLRSTSKNLI